MVILALTMLALAAEMFVPIFGSPDSATICGAICFGQSVINFSNNAFYQAPIAGLIPLFCFIFLAQLIPLLQLYRKQGPPIIGAIGITATLLLLLVIFGKDLAVWSFLATLNLLVLLGQLYERRENFTDYVIALPAAILMLLLAGTLAIPAMIVAGLFLLAHNHRRGAALIAITFCFALLMGIIVPGPDLPGYPAGAALVPGYNTVDGLTPLLGDQLLPRTVNLSLVRERTEYLLPVLLVALLSTLVLRSRITVLAFGLIAAVSFDSALILPFFAQLMPIQSLSRLLPGGQFYPLASLALAGALFTLLAEYKYRSSTDRIRQIVYAVGLGTCCFAVVKLDLGEFKPNSDLALLRALNEGAVVDLEAANSQLISPSYFVAASIGYEEMTKRLRIGEADFKNATDELIGLDTFTGEFDPVILSDGRDSTAWHSGRGMQTGEEWMQLSFVRPISALRLSTGSFFTDFPRALRVRYMADCPADRSLWNAAPVALYLNPSNGDVKLTDAGLPYFGSQYIVSAYLPVGISARCVLVEQIGRDSNYGWSVAEVQVSEEHAVK